MIIMTTATATLFPRGYHFKFTLINRKIYHYSFKLTPKLSALGATHAILEALHAQVIVCFTLLRIHQNFIRVFDLLELFLCQFARVLVGVELWQGILRIIFLFTVY